MASIDVADRPNVPDFLTGGGAMGALIRQHDWSHSPLGPPDRWPQSLRSVVDLLLHSKFPMFVAWGQELGFVYNDPYAEILGVKHPAALGARFHDIWDEIWPEISPLIDAAMAGEASYHENLPLVMRRKGFDEQTFFTFSYSPVRDESGAIAGMFCACTETTKQVVGERRRDALLTLDSILRDVAATGDLSFAASELLGRALGVQRVGYGVIDGAEHTIAVERNWSAPGFADVAGVHRFQDYGDYIDELLSGTPVANADVEVDPRTSANMAAFRALGIGAHLDVPVVEDGRAVAEMFVHSAVPRIWTAEEIAFVRDIAERTHAAIARRAAEQEHRDSEERFRAVFNSDLVGLTIFDTGTRVTETINDRFLKMTGHSRADFEEGRWDWRDFTVSEYLPLDEAAIAQAQERGWWDPYEKYYRALDGRLFPVRLSSAPLPGYPGKVIVSVEDITERTKAEAALRESEARFRLMADAVPQIVWITDADGKAEFFNKQWADYTGSDYHPGTAAEVAASHVHPDDIAPTMKAYEDSRRTGATFLVEHRIRSKSGDYRWFLVRGEPYHDPQTGRITRWFGASVDIHDRKMAEAALRRLNDTLEEQVAARSAERDRLWNLSQDMLARADFGGMMSAVSPAWERVLGWDEGALLSRPYADFMHPDDVRPTLDAIARMAETGRPARFQNRIATSDGGWKHIEWTVAPEPGGANFIAVGRDLTDGKQQEEELEVAREALRQSQKMEALGQLTGGIAHDFNNLLTPIVGALDLLRRKADEERSLRLIDGALTSAERARTLIARLLSFARRQRLEARDISLTRLMLGTVDMLKRAIGPKVRLDLDLPDGDLCVRVDPNQLELALLNLAVNARDAMEDGGTLTIRGSKESIGAGDRASLGPGDYARILVEDDGHGMDADTLRLAIEPFYTTKELGRGTGLGLSMVHGLAAQSEGALHISSEVGKGTRIELWLPLGSGAPDTEQERSDEPLGEVTPLKILLVDDEDLVRAATADMLVEVGHTVHQAHSGPTALNIFSSDPTYDLLVTDYAMPLMSGAALIRGIKELAPTIPALLVTGYASATTDVPADVPRIEKPFRAVELIRRIEELAGSKARRTGAATQPDAV
ncbi:MAG TPA: PAS domain S-box protein [Sphingomicrobium sp.]|jgi:PAS domain S-box-containing protein